MKKILLVSVFILVSLFTYSQEKPKKSGKKGWNFGALPTLTYNSDLGFQYGVLTNIYHYGDGGTYPKYKHSVYAEVSRYTKGSGKYRIFYDSEFLIPNIRVTAGLSYLPNQAQNFFGFNGYESIYNPDFKIQEKNQDGEDIKGRSRMFYNHKRNILTFNADFQGKLYKNNLRWVAGYNIMDVKVGPVPVEKLNKGSKNPILSGENHKTLYEHYVDWGLIQEKEKNGGLHNNIKVGIVYDTRDKEPMPTKGNWSEVVLVNSFGNGYNFGRLSATQRGYFSFVPNKLSFAYRLGYQGVVYGKVPFYLLPHMQYSYMSSPVQEGLGGSGTIRGMMLNRTVGKGVVFSNLELRYKFAHFGLFGQNFYTALSLFTDAGMVVQKVKIDKTKIGAEVNQADYFGEKEGIHPSFGGGFRIGMNENFIVAIDYGRSKKEDGGSGLYIGMNWLF